MQNAQFIEGPFLLLRTISVGVLTLHLRTQELFDFHHCFVAAFIFTRITLKPLSESVLNNKGHLIVTARLMLFV